MVTIKEIFDLLAEGELSHTSLSYDHTGSLAEEEYGKIIGHINMGLLELYKRFKLSQEEIQLYLYPGLELYQLRGDRVGILQNMNYQTYILDQSVALFQGSLLEITHVYNSLGDELCVNNRRASPMILTVSHDTLKISPVEDAEVLSIVYQAAYPKIVLTDDFDPNTCELFIPDVVIEALLSYVASRVYKPMGSNASSADADKSTSYSQQYELACQKIDTFGLSTQNNDSRQNFEQGGFV